MPPLPPVPKVLKVTEVGTAGIDTDVVTRTFWQYSGVAPTQTQANTFASAVSQSWTTNLSSLVDTAFALKTVTVEDLTSSMGATGLWSGSAGGGRAGTLIPASTAVVTSFVIARRYRGGHPRVYRKMGVASDLSDQSDWQGAFVTNVLAGTQAWYNQIIGQGWVGAGALNLVNVSYWQGFTPVVYPSGRYKNVPKARPGGPVVDIVSSFKINPRPASQRRRNLQSR